MRENGLLAPHRVGRTEAKPHDGTIITDKVIADAILDRLVHNAHRLTLKGESMRKTAAKRAELLGVRQRRLEHQRNAVSRGYIEANPWTQDHTSRRRVRIKAVCAFEDIDLTGNIEIVGLGDQACPLSGFAVFEKGPAQFKTRPMP
jgi:hypothetical protein